MSPWGQPPIGSWGDVLALALPAWISRSHRRIAFSQPMSSEGVAPLSVVEWFATIYNLLWMLFFFFRPSRTTGSDRAGRREARWQSAHRLISTERRLSGDEHD